MFVGREEELGALERLYRKSGFQMVVLYGRRRVGKTTLLDKFSEGKPTLYFTAQVQSATMNLRSFSQTAYRFFDLPATTGAFESWSDAFAFVASRAKSSSEPILFVFDEFPYAAESEPSLPSSLQIAIDHEFKNTDIRIILSGSNEGFMESEVLGRKSPLYGRRTSQIKLQPFDYLDAARMIPATSDEERIRDYTAFGGTPYYLAQIDSNASFEENIEFLFFNKAGLLYEEPMMLLRQELREPANYNSILSAVANGATFPKEIAEKAGVEQGSIGKYLKTLEGLGLIERTIPFGDNPDKSRKGLYSVRDPFFAYWYRFVSRSIGAIESGAGNAAARGTAFGEAFSTYVGKRFEDICMQWLIRRNRQGNLPFLASSFGRWWGTDPVAHEQTDIDVIAADKPSKRILLGECKWRESLDETEALRKLEARAPLVKGYDQHSFALFTKNPVSDATKKKCASRNDLLLVSTADLFEDLQALPSRGTLRAGRPAFSLTPPGAA